MTKLAPCGDCAHIPELSSSKKTIIDPVLVILFYLSFFLSPRMASITSVTLKNISRDSPVFPGQLIGIVVFMTVNTTKQTKITWCRMALCTTVPFPPVVTGINGKIICIMIPETRRHPIRFQGMTQSTIRRKTGYHMVGLLRRSIIIGMTRKTIL